MHNKFEFVTLKYLTNTHVCVCNCVFVRESSATSVTRAVDIWPSLSHPEKSSQSLRDLFFHCRWSRARFPSIGCGFDPATESPQLCIKGCFHPPVPPRHLTPPEDHHCRETCTGKCACVSLLLFMQLF